MSHRSMDGPLLGAAMLVVSLTLPCSAVAAQTTPSSPVASRAATPARSAAAAIPGANVVEIVAMDYAFEMPAQIPAGLTTLRLTNTGKELHHVYLVKVEAGKSAADVMAWFRSGGPPPAWAKPMGGPNASAGATEFTRTLEAGDYVAFCVIPSPGGPPHVMKGMIKDIKVTPSSRAAAPEPKADITLTLSDYDFQLSRPLTAGRHIIAVKNTGPQPHEFFLARLLPGKTPMDMAVFAENPQGEPPGIPMGGITDIVPGDVVYLAVDVPPGEYALICFDPDAKDGKPHLAHGMIKQITVK
jgi:hypothetical protein